jgi:DNA-binding CsgD family transcriptional regulator/PAS domain-containing protein
MEAGAPVCAMCGQPHHPSAACEQLALVARSLDLYAVPAFLTDRYNRITWVNRAFARLVGDPVRDGIPLTLRFVAAALLGPYRARFPRRKLEVAACLQGLPREVEDGALATPTLRLLDDALALDEDVRRLVAKGGPAWDGTILIRPEGERTPVLVREQVVPLAGPTGTPNSFHVSLWLPVDQDLKPATGGPLFLQGGAPSLLTPRQLQIARWFAAGLTSSRVAERAGISQRTAHDHLEEIYARLGVHSRAELVTVLAHEGLV